ncbi:MAG: transcriptional repressor [Acidobacteriota bacterium]|nr:MAG: transcriptional repressor [Acidobacteriota bacterium]
MGRKAKDFEEEQILFENYLRSAGLRRTEQRDLILRTFLDVGDHITSEDLYRLVSEIDPTVGLTTVYRTLKLLTAAGLAQEVRFGDNKTYYEKLHSDEHHDHMICTSCGLVIEFFSPDIEALQDEMAASFGFEATHHSLRLWGYCAKCKASAGKLTNAPPGAEPRVRVKSGRTVVR